MRVLVHPADVGGCGYYRLRWAVQELAAQGADVTVGDKLGGVYRDDPDGTPRLLSVKRPDADVVVFQRVLRREILDAIPHLQAQGVAVVVEIDDDFHALPPSNPARALTDPVRHPDYNRDVLMAACAQADLVTCTTDALAKRYGHGRSVVIPNYVRGAWLKLEPVRAERVIGWTGVVTTHRGDLDVMQLTVPDGWKFRNIGSLVSQRVLGIPDEQFESREWLNLLADAYPLALGEFTIGVVPLAHTTFNRAKSWLKGIEYAALGVPFVASDVADYVKLRKRGIGLVASNPAQWSAIIRRLTTDDAYRAECGAANREAARTLTIEHNVEQWWSAWTRAAKRRANRG